MTARRVVHLSGAYDEAMRKAESRGLLNKADAFAASYTPVFPVDSAMTGPPRAPESWGRDVDLPIDRRFPVENLAEYSSDPWNEAESAQPVPA